MKGKYKKINTWIESELREVGNEFYHSNLNSKNVTDPIPDAILYPSSLPPYHHTFLKSRESANVNKTEIMKNPKGCLGLFK